MMASVEAFGGRDRATSSRRALVVRLVLLAHLVIGLVLLLILHIPAERGEALAYTSCTLRGPRVVMDTPRIGPEDRIPLHMHEAVHAQQCKERGWRGPFVIAWTNASAGGRLSLEAPAYCAGARARVRRGDDYTVTRERLFDDANAMFAGSLDSQRVNAALRAACPELVAP